MMIYNRKIPSYVLLFALILSNQSCSTYKAYSKPSIKESKDWQMTEKCLYQGCAHKFEALKGRDIEIIIQSNNGISDENIFTMKLFFEVKGDGYFFNPALSETTINNRSFVAKGLTCENDYANLEHLRSVPSLNYSVPIKSNDCFVLFFDTNPPNIDQEFTLHLKGLMKWDQSLKIQPIKFNKATHKGNWGKTIE